MSIQSGKAALRLSNSTFSKSTPVSIGSEVWCQCFDFGLTKVLWTPAPKERFLGTRHEDERMTGMRDFLPECWADRETGEEFTFSDFETSRAEFQVLVASCCDDGVEAIEERETIDERL